MRLVQVTKPGHLTPGGQVLPCRQIMGTRHTDLQDEQENPSLFKSIERNIRTMIQLQIKADRERGMQGQCGKKNRLQRHDHCQESKRKGMEGGNPNLPHSERPRRHFFTEAVL